MSFRKPRHMPFRKLIPPFTITESVSRSRNYSLNFIRLLRVVITPSVTEGVITTRSNRMKFRLP